MIYTWPDAELPKRIAFVSDLHLMSTRSTAESYREQIADVIDRSELVVWGGDLFDFRWSRFRHETDSVAFAINYLCDWMTEYPSKSFAFLCGNHDANAALLCELKAMSEDQSRFHFAGDVMRVGDTVMLHGDQIEGRGTEDRFLRYRNRWAEKKRAAPWRFPGYDAIVVARAHKVAAAIAHRNRMAVRKLSRFLALSDLNRDNGVRRVVFGHTHRIITGLEHNRVLYFNGGAAIRHVRFKPVELENNSS